MRRRQEGRHRAGMLGLFLAGCVLVSPPLLSGFGREAGAGLLVWLFGSWALLVLLLAWAGRGR